MRKMILFLLTGLVLFSFQGCGVHTRISSSRSPSFSGRIYKKILVEARDRNQNEIVGLEWAFKRKMENPQLEVLTHADLFPLSSSYSPDEKIEIMKQKGIEGILLANLQDVHQEATYYPPTTTTEVEKKKNKGVRITTYQTGGYTSIATVQKHDLSMIDIQELKPVWVSDATTRGAGEEEQDYYKALAGAVLKNLSKNGLVIVPEK